MSAKVVSISGDEEARQRIRTSLDETLIVEAAAGTGKTSVLVARIAQALESGRAEVGRIVAVTFTHKAAGELKLRLRDELDKRIAEAEGEARERLGDALAHLEEAIVGTIHSFCAQILRERPVEASVDPVFEELNELQASRLQERAFREWFETSLNMESPALRRALSRIAADRSLSIDSLRFALRSLVEWRDHPAPWARPAWDRNAAVDAAAAKVLETAPRISAAKYPEVRALAQWIERFETVRPRDYDLLEARLSGLRHDLRRKKGLDELNFLLERFRRDSAADLVPALREEMLPILERYRQLKRANGKLDFLDLLILARDMVRSHREVREYLQRRFTHLFVDEFQDTDPLQAELLLLLAADDPGETDWRRAQPVPGKLFVVGDPKQSIYKFRRADVVLYEEIKRNLEERGARVVHLTRNFRASAPIQEFVNRAFAPVMTGESGQARYVPLREGAEPASDRPSLVALPVPRPYGKQRYNREAINTSLPAAVCAFIAWMVKESGWKKRDGSPFAASDVCVLFRRFVTGGQDMARGYARGLEARGIPHLLIGSRSFHQREEVEMLRTALQAVEWPEDELAVFAALKGSLFSCGDAALLRYRMEVGRLHPFAKRPGETDEELAPVFQGLDLLARLHSVRNRRPVAETINDLLEAARLHAALALRPAGHQVLANVHRIAGVARVYESGGGFSFRGFVEELDLQARKSDSSESPILEEDAAGVRLMTVHSAKGLEFPAVVLADLTARLNAEHPERYVRGELCAMQLLRLSPAELLVHEEEELERERAEGIRVAYVAATRAKDLLIVPNCGDGPLKDNWLEPLEPALFPEPPRKRQPKPAPGCPKFGGSTVLERPPELFSTNDLSVKPGLHGDVVWWDPAILDLDAAPHYGLRHSEILAADGPGVSKGAADYDQWRKRRDAAIAAGTAPSVRIFLPAGTAEPPPEAAEVEVIRLERPPDRPGGRRVGSLVHEGLRSMSTDGLSVIARTLGATDDEVAAAEAIVAGALDHPLLVRARQSARVLREEPLTLPLANGEMLDGVIDLAFLEEERWTVVDFKTDADLDKHLKRYMAQVQWYAYALSRITGLPARPVLLSL